MNKSIVSILVLFSVSTNAQVPQVEAFLKKLNGIEGRSYSVKVQVPPSEDLSVRQKEVVSKMQASVQASLPDLLLGLSKALLLESGDSKKILMTLSKDTSGKLIESLKEYRENLDDSDQLTVSAYFLPWLLKGGAPEVEVTDDKKSLIPKLYGAVRAAQNFGIVSKSPYYFTGLHILVHLQKGQSRLVVQVLGGLKPGEYEFEKSNDQVKISHLVVPESESPSMVLLNMEQSLEEKGLPLFEIRFGPFDGISTGRMFSSLPGLFQSLEVMIGSEKCKFKGDSVPYLKGTLAEGALNVPLLKKLVEGHRVNFKIFDFTIHPESFLVENMDMRLSIKTAIGEFDCIERDDVKEQFSDEVNSAIQSQLESLYSQDDLTDDLLDYLYDLN